MERVITWEERVSDPPGQEDERTLSYDQLPRPDVPGGQHSTALARQGALLVHLPPLPPLTLIESSAGTEVC